MHLFEKSKDGKTTEMDLRYTGIWESAVRAGCSFTSIFSIPPPGARVLTKRAGRFAHAQEMFKTCSTTGTRLGAIDSALGKSIHRWRFETFLEKKPPI